MHEWGQWRCDGGRKTCWWQAAAGVLVETPYRGLLRALILRIVPVCAVNSGNLCVWFAETPLQSSEDHWNSGDTGRGKNSLAEEQIVGMFVRFRRKKLTFMHKKWQAQENVKGGTRPKLQERLFHKGSFPWGNGLIIMKTSLSTWIVSWCSFPLVSPLPYRVNFPSQGGIQNMNVF